MIIIQMKIMTRAITTTTKYQKHYAAIKILMLMTFTVEVIIVQLVNWYNYLHAYTCGRVYLLINTSAQFHKGTYTFSYNYSFENDWVY